MTTWSPGDGGHEVLSYGGERPPRRPSPLLVGGLVGLAAGVALGLAVGARFAPPEAVAAADEESRVPAVAAGVVTKLPGPVDANLFAVSLFSSADENVDATVVDLPGWGPRLTGLRPVTITPRSWSVVRFSAPVECRAYPALVRAVHVRVRSGDDVADQLVPLAAPAEALREHHDAACD